MIPENFFIFYEGEDPLIEAPYFCQTKQEAIKQYKKWVKEFPIDEKRLYIAEIIQKPKGKALGKE